ncbi:hypothetical protein [Pedobacter sp. ASV28]|uniref:hypothetical protein n=1 Tax=Pedobacter sp. ASV28 TaxID=2795123 RepID=UPI0018EBA563|nr:hypothetical protein [Pedobacter sp. ASV28]
MRKTYHCIICLYSLLYVSCSNDKISYNENELGIETHVSSCKDSLQYDYFPIDGITTSTRKPIAKLCNTDTILNALWQNHHVYDVYYNGSILNSAGYNIRMITFVSGFDPKFPDELSYLIVNHFRDRNKIYIIPCGVSEADAAIRIVSSFRDDKLIIFKTNTPDYDTGAKTTLHSYSLVDFSKDGKLTTLNERQADSTLKINSNIKAAYDKLLSYRYKNGPSL